MPPENDPTKTAGTTTGAAAADDTGQSQQNQNGDAGNVTDKRYTEDDVKKLLQSEGDRRVTEALKKKDKELEELKRQMELEKLSAEERKEEERKQREKELEEERKKLEADKRDYETIKVIAERKLDPDLIELVKPVESLEDRKKALDLFDKLVKKEVDTRLKDLQTGSFPSDNKGKKPVSKYVNKVPEKTIFDRAREKIK